MYDVSICSSRSIYKCNCKSEISNKLILPMKILGKAHSEILTEHFYANRVCDCSIREINLCECSIREYRSIFFLSVRVEGHYPKCSTQDPPLNGLEVLE